jgi:hypothetical protein
LAACGGFCARGTLRTGSERVGCAAGFPVGPSRPGSLSHSGRKKVLDFPLLQQSRTGGISAKLLNFSTVLPFGSLVSESSPKLPKNSNLLKNP